MVAPTNLDPSRIDPRALGMARSGETVTFTGEGGYQGELDRALKLWTIGTELLVEACDIQGWSSDYRFAGWPGAHNTVMFQPTRIAKALGTTPNTEERP